MRIALALFIGFGGWMVIGCATGSGERGCSVCVQKPPATAGAQTKVLEEHWPDGTLRKRETVLVEEDGTVVKHGPSTYWHRNGKKRYEATYEHGKLEGTATSWHDNGERAVMEQYVDGKRHGLRIAWDPQGHKRMEERYFMDKPHGTWTIWKGDGKIKWRGYFEHGKPVSEAVGDKASEKS